MQRCDAHVDPFLSVLFLSVLLESGPGMTNAQEALLNHASAPGILALLKPRMDAKRRELSQGCLQVCIGAALSMTVDRPVVLAFAFVRVHSRFSRSLLSRNSLPQTHEPPGANVG